MSEHVADHAAFIAALPEDDQERKLAEEHARSCASCRAALDEGRRLVSLLEEALPLPPPTPEALTRAAAAIEAETSHERRSRTRLAWGVGAAVVGSWIFQIACGIGTKMDFAAGTVIVSLVTLATSVAILSIVRSRRDVALGAIVASSGLLAVAAARVPGLEPTFGVHCTLYELTAAAIPWVTATIVARYERLPQGRWNMAAFAAAGALGSQAAQHISCPVAHADAHLLVFHLGGVALAAMLGALGPVRLPKTVSAS
jgi:hypothetical protein